jgi:anti-sigma factor RsiW
MTCPNFDILIDYADDKLQPQDAAAVKAHLATGCDACSTTLEWYAGFVATATADTSVEPPVWVTRRAFSLFSDAREAASRRGLRGIVSRLRAALVFDSLAGATASDMIPARGAAAPSRQLLFTAAPYDVDLFVAGGSTPESVSVTGQVLTTDAEDFESVRGLVVSLERGGEILASVATSEFGEFTVRDLAPGVYDVRLASQTREIILEATPLSLE